MSEFIPVNPGSSDQRAQAPQATNATFSQTSASTVAPATTDSMSGPLESSWAIPPRYQRGRDRRTSANRSSAQQSRDRKKQQDLEREALLERQEATIAEQTMTITEQADMISHQAWKIATQKTTIEDQHNTIAGQSSFIAEQETTIAAQNATIDELRARLDEYQQYLQSVQSYHQGEHQYE
ncbi:uncharacterized protein I303_107768 [Kwoniella dejecticola CBS 10117]|uniref:BZIP domain-containing protein n=1 Tax=Kwoniella dejecticola CBS 10117 TaxID=1296121 RepID=A0A1A5ZVM5_9TREE|nr:uncharacterized protein I303_07773 [Kwoniella dejecticola CBS 10117]OBR81863.1 hypothetical protein I303_07773 [Kwoniella dejecticola CBS 10117]